MFNAKSLFFSTTFFCAILNLKNIDEADRGYIYIDYLGSFVNILTSDVHNQFKMKGQCSCIKTKSDNETH